MMTATDDAPEFTLLTPIELAPSSFWDETFETKEAAALLNITPLSLQRRAKRGAIQPARNGKRYLFTRRLLRSYLLREHPTTATANQQPAADDWTDRARKFQTAVVGSEK